MADVDGDGLPDLVMQGVVLLRRPFAGVWPAAAAGGPAASQSVSQPLRRRLLPMLSKPGQFR